MDEATLAQIRRELEGKVSKEVFDATINALKEDMSEVKGDISYIRRSTAEGQRTAVWNLVMIIVTLIVAVIGAWGAFTP